MIRGLREKLGLPTDDTAPESFHDPRTQMVVALRNTGQHVYGGTVPRAEVDRRRAKNRAGRAARRRNRGRR